MISSLNPADGAHLARKWSCVWRPDVGSRLYARGSWQEAGGVGGLAWRQTGIAQTVAMDTYQSVTGNAEVHIPMMDHMGNVRHYYQIKSTGPGTGAATVTGQVTANLDYDAFGREVRATGLKTPTSGQPPGLTVNDPWVDVLPFHFSTKFTDRESGLNYYGYRFYGPVDGRWLNRDPIEETGGINLYSFVANRSSLAIDNLGLWLYDPIVKKVSKCEAYLYIGHGGAADPILWDNELCSVSGAITCQPAANQPFVVPFKFPNVPTHNDPMMGNTIGAASAATAHAAIAAGVPTTDPTIQRDPRIALDNALSAASIADIEAKLCNAGCCTDWMLIVEVGKDKWHDSFIESIVSKRGWKPGKTYKSAYKCPP